MLDLRRTSYLSSAGIALLLEIADTTRARGRSLAVENALGAVARSLSLAGIDCTFTRPATSGRPGRPPRA